MRLKLLLLSLALPAAAFAQATQPAAQTGAEAGQAPAASTVARPSGLVADGIPDVPADLADRTRPYMEFRSAGFAGWHPRDRSMLISTRFANTAQLHRVAAPMHYRQQLSFEPDPLGGSWSPAGDVMVVSKDVGGNEFFQLYTLANGRLNLLTDGRSRNNFGSWSQDGRWIGYSSTRRNGADTDLYVMDPRDRSTDRLVAQVEGGGWNIADFAPDGRRAVVINYRQVTNSDLYLLDIASGRMTPIGDTSRDIAFGGAQFAPDGTLWVTSDEGSDFQRLGTVDIATGRFTPVSREPRWDVENFDLSEDGNLIAYVTNEAGISRLKLLDRRSGQARTVSGLPQGVIGGLEIAPWGTIGLTLSSARSPADAFSVDPQSLAVTRWTRSETGGLDPEVNVEPELVEVRSFDGERVSGFLYRPDPARFPGRRPMIVSIHGGPRRSRGPASWDATTIS
jgi:dipeptidyl aminopeptidase/acylaminoacyl peptidase